MWSYPLREGDDEEVVFNMVNALLLRVHQSGHLAELSPRRRELVKEALDYYKKIRTDIPEALPFWPLGLPTAQNDWVSLGLRKDDHIYLAVWRVKDSIPENDGRSARKTLPLQFLKGKTLDIQCAYPQNFASDYTWTAALGELEVVLPASKTARLYEIIVKE
ncbi:hypothetical protein D3C73_1284980 [compost metagenome]